MIRGLAILAALLFFAAPALAAESPAFEQGNQALAAGEYDRAVTLYEQASAEAGVSPGLLLNLGTAQEKAGRLGLAIASYTRALALAPGYKPAADGLARARAAAGISAPAVPWWKKPFLVLSLNQWAATAAGLWFLLGLLFLAGRFFKKNKVPVRALAGFFGGLLVLALAGAFQTGRVLDLAVVTAPDAALLVSPFKKAGVIHPAPEGETLTLQKTHNGYYLAILPSGATGWIAQDAVTPAVPPADGVLSGGIADTESS